MSLPYVNSLQKTVLNSAKTWEPKRLLSSLSNMYDGTFLSIELFSQKSYIVDICQDLKYHCEHYDLAVLAM